MQVFKSALLVFLRHPIYIVVYIVWLGAMGLFMGNATANVPQSGFNESRPTAAVIDRDGSDLSRSLSSFVASNSDIVGIDDSEQALQDATAQDQAAYIVIIPAGFGDGFMAASRDGAEAPVLDTIVSYRSYSGSMMDGLVNEYLDTVQAHVAAGTATTQIDASRQAGADMEEDAEVEVTQLNESAPVSQQFLLYLEFSSYTILLSITVCTAVALSKFNQADVRRRNYASPMPSWSMNLQIALACLVIAVIAWAWTAGLGLAVFGASLMGVDPFAVILALTDLLAYALVALALGFLIGQLSRSELVMNAATNVIGLTWCFLGGIWISLDLVGEPVATLARATPAFYYGDALSAAFGQRTPASMDAFSQDIFMILLFALALFAVAFAVGRLRRQTTLAIRGRGRRAETR